MCKQKKLVYAVSCCLGVLWLGVGSAMAADVTPISFDPDGSGSLSAITVGSFDWSVASGLVTRTDATPAIPIAPGTSKEVQNYVHGALVGLAGSSGNPIGLPPGINTDYELTYVGGFGENAAASPDGINVDLSLVQSPDANNFFRVYYDNFSGGNQQSDALTGMGYSDGTQILKGLVVDASGSFTIGQLPPLLEIFDQSPDGDDYAGKLSVNGNGSSRVAVMVLEADPAFFPNMKPGSIVYFNNSQVAPFKQVNPSRNFEIFANAVPNPIPGIVAADLGNASKINAVDGPDMELQIDPNSSFTEIKDEKLGCRVTGGGNDTSGITYDVNGKKLPGWDGSIAEDSLVRTGLVKVKGKWVTQVIGTDEYTFGGQAGANTALQPQPKGEWEHNQHSGPSGQWAFHAGTASKAGGGQKPDLTEIDNIVCSDSGWCKQARPAPTKQIDFEGVGTFSNIIDKGSLAAFTIGDGTGHGANFSPLTYHWFEVHIEDLGEPGSKAPEAGANCPAGGSGTDAFATPPVFNLADCKCPDFYRIRIYNGVPPTFNPDGTIITNTADIKAAKSLGPIYEVHGYIDGGNFQIHPLTGFDLKQLP